MKLPRTDIDGDTQPTGARIILPRLELSAGCVENPAADSQNEIRGLSQGNKVIRRDNAQLWMLPANKRFSTYWAVLAIHLDLVIELKLLILYRIVQCISQLSLQCHRLLHGRIKKAHLITPGGFRLIEAYIGLFKQLFD